MSDTTDAPTTSELPRWFEVLAWTGPIAMGAVGLLGLLLAILGVYSGWLALALGVPVAAATVWGLHRVRPRDARPVERAATAAALAAVALALGYFAFAGSVPSQNVFTTRDPGVYLNTARWLSAEGELGGDAQDPAFEGIDGLRFDSAGVYNMGGGELEFQFNHLASVVMSVGHDLGGYRLLVRTPALATAAGLLAVYAVTVRVTRRPWVSLLAPTVLAASLPFLFVSRNTYSEPFAFALLWGAVLLLADLHHRPRRTTALAGGLLLGAVLATRVDALAYVALLFPLAALSLMAAAGPGERRARARAWGIVVAATGLGAVVGIVDLVEWTGHYVRDLTPQLRLLRLATIASAAASLVALGVWTWTPALRRLVERFRAQLAGVAAAAIVAVLGAGWLLRPLVQTVRGGTAHEPVRNAQRFYGLAVDPARTYAEQSLRWMAWYLGPVTLAAAILGLAVIAYLAVRRRGVAPVAVGVVLLTLAAGALYWWNPAITPDHPWASRRYVPAVLPGLAVAAVVPLAAIAARRSVQPRLRGALVGVLAVAMVVPAAATTWPVRWQRNQYGYLHQVFEACELLPEDAAVVVLGVYAQSTLTHTLRSWCEVPAAGQGDAVDADNVLEVAEQVRANGHRLVLVGKNYSDLTTFLDVAEGPPRWTRQAAPDRWLVRPTVDRPPNGYVDPSNALPDETPFRLHLVVVDVD